MFRRLFLPLLLAPLAGAQTTVEVGPDGAGCQPEGALLTDGTVASATASFAYDAATAILRVTVTNTSPVIPGVANPLITRIYFAAPPGLIETADLIGQTGSGGLEPAFLLSFAADSESGDKDNYANCFGHFDFALSVKNGNNGGIANALADTHGCPPDACVLGPVEFTIELTGPGVAGLTGSSFAASSSTDASTQAVHVAMKFQGGGVAGGSGTISSTSDCVTGLFMRGTPSLGSEIRVCANGGNGCHACVMASFVEGPAAIGGILVPIGLPIITTFDVGDFFPPTTELCLPLTIPYRPELIGLTVYFANITHPPDHPELFSFSEPFSFTVTL